MILMLHFFRRSFAQRFNFTISFHQLNPLWDYIQKDTHIFLLCVSRIYLGIHFVTRCLFKLVWFYCILFYIVLLNSFTLIHWQRLSAWLKCLLTLTQRSFIPLMFNFDGNSRSVGNFRKSENRFLISREWIRRPGLNVPITSVYSSPVSCVTSQSSRVVLFPTHLVWFKLDTTIKLIRAMVQNKSLVND